MALAFVEAGARAVYCVDLPTTPDEKWAKVKEFARGLGGKAGGEGRLEYISADVRDQVRASGGHPELDAYGREGQPGRGDRLR